MNNATATAATIDTIGGLYTEAPPEKLPNGASPFCLNNEFIVQQAGQRPGKQSAFYFTNLFIEKLARFAASVAGSLAPNEVPWSNPTNATLNIPGTYASVTVNAGFRPGIPGSVVAKTNGSGNTNWAAVLALFKVVPGQTPVVLQADVYNNITSTTPGSTLIIAAIGGNTSVPNPPGTFAPTDNQGNLYVAINATQNAGNGDDIAQPQANMYVALATVGGAITINPHQNTPHGFNGSIYCIEVTNLIAVDASGAAQNPDPSHWSATSAPCSATATQAGDYAIFIVNGQTGHTDITVAGQGLTWNAQSPGNTNNQVWAGPASGGLSDSQILRTLNYGFSIPSTQNIIGLEVEISGNQNSTAPAAILSVALSNPVPGSPTLSTQLPASDGTVVVGTPITNWGLALTPNLLNDPNFGFDIVAHADDGTLVTFDIFAVKIKAFLTPNPPPDFNYIKTFTETGGEILTLALGSDGIIYQEDVVNAPGGLSAVYTEIEPESFAQSCTQDDREFIAISNLLNGTDIPYTYTPPNFDRLTQVGPGAPCSASTSSSSQAVVSVTQNAKVNIPTSTSGTSGSWIIWAAAPQDTGTFGNPSTPGNVMTWVFPRAFVLPSYIQPGTNIVMSGVQSMGGYNPNNGVGNNPAYYTITAVGTPIAGQDYYDGFSITLPQTGFYNQRFQAGAAFQSTIATMTAAAQVPNLEVGSQFQLTATGGAPPAGYDSTWLVLTTPNASQLLINATQLVNGVATYSYTLLTGTNPVAGQFITVSETLNGNGVFNVAKALVASASPGSFTINIPNAANVTSAAETGSGIIFGTIFTFDAFAAIGNKTGGQIVTVGTIAQGQRKICYSYLTRNGMITQPSPVFTFQVTQGASAIAVANLSIGPSNVIARIIHLTGADGGNFYNIPAPVSVISNGQTVVNSSTWILDNSTTNVTLSFSDTVLLSADQIDIQGNNLFECLELGSCVALIPYSGRIVAIGEQNKVQNFRNLSFDGGTGIVGGNSSAGLPQPPDSTANQIYPLGWTVDPTNGVGESMVLSPLFGWALQIQNLSGVTKAIYGMITQPAYQDEFLVPIINSQTTYSVRITAAVPTGAASGNLVVDLFSPKFGKAFGTMTLPLNSIGSSMAIYTGTLLTTKFAQVPNDLLLRVYTTSLPNGVQVQTDRVEPFPTEAPNLNTQVILSYKQAFEQFDRTTGVISGNTQNQQPIVTAFVLNDSLHLNKTACLISTTDNNTTEPSDWSIPRTVSNSVGAWGVNAVTTAIDEPNAGEEYALIANSAGAFIYFGAQPIKLSEEIQAVWRNINPTYAYTTWIKNDIANRRILIGVPLKTNNQTWAPSTYVPVNLNPTTPNVILELNYKQLNTASQLAESPEVHRSYSGKLLASEITRKWSIWTIKAPCAAQCTRNDGSNTLLLGNSDDNGKIFQLVDNLMQDDGVAIPEVYTTAALVGTDEGQGLQLGVTRFLFEYMSLILTGVGDCQINVFPNTLDSPFAHALLPDLTLPASSNGDVEVPVQEAGSRLFVQFVSNTVGTRFELSRLVMAMSQDPWAPVRGVNQ